MAVDKNRYPFAIMLLVIILLPIKWYSSMDPDSGIKYTGFLVMNYDYGRILTIYIFVLMIQWISEGRKYFIIRIVAQCIFLFAIIGFPIFMYSIPIRVEFLSTICSALLPSYSYGVYLVLLITAISILMTVKSQFYRRDDHE